MNESKMFLVDGKPATGEMLDLYREVYAQVSLEIKEIREQRPRGRQSSFAHLQGGGVRLRFKKSTSGHAERPWAA